MAVIQLDGEQLRKFVAETLRQIALGAADGEAEGLVTEVGEDVTFTVQVVAAGGLNAVKRASEQGPPAERVTVEETAPLIDVTRRTNSQSTVSEQSETSEAMDTTRTSDTVSEKTTETSLDNNSTSQTQSQGSGQITTIEYDR